MNGFSPARGGVKEEGEMNGCCKALIFLSLIILFGLVGTGVVAQIPDPDDVAAMAVYHAADSTSDEWPDHLVNYNITDQDTIDAMFAGIESDTLRDCSDLEAKAQAYVYVKLDGGSRIVYHIYFLWSHISKYNRRDRCYWIEEPSRLMFQRHAQP
jgi:hypothetical protein